MRDPKQTYSNIMFELYHQKDPAWADIYLSLGKSLSVRNMFALSGKIGDKIIEELIFSLKDVLEELDESRT